VDATPEPDAIVREIHVDASPATVFEFFIDPVKLTRWLAMEATVDPRPGGLIHQLHAGPEDGDGSPYVLEGKFIEVTPPERVVFTWGFTNEDVGVPPGSSIVEVTLTPAGSGTHVRLVHRDLPDSARGDHEGGWTDMLERLASVASTTRTEQR
jgi:uncharacterized protein YndB with AHSA1/START domain